MTKDEGRKAKGESQMRVWHKWQRVGGILIALVFLIFVWSWTKHKPESWNDIARVAAIESLVERGDWALDDSLWVNQTQDKILLNGRFYSDKMPVLTMLGAGVYAVLHHVFGMSLAPNCVSCAYAWLVRLLVALPAAGMLWLFFDFVWRKTVAPVALFATVALGISTMLFPYALVLNHHAPAATALFASFYLLTRHVPSRHELVLAGFLAALALAFDVLAGFVGAGLFGIALLRYRRASVYFAIGGAVPLLWTALLDYHIAGTVMPLYTLTYAYDYPGSAFPATIAGNGTPDDYAAYIFRMFVGGQGLFAFNPLLLFALAGAARVALNRQHTLRIEATCIALAFVALAVYLSTNTGNYGGNAYGQRWYITTIPTLWAFILFVPPLSAATWKHATWLLFLPLFALAVFSTLQGASAPWVYVPPPLQMTRDTSHFPFIGFRWNVRFP